MDVNHAVCTTSPEILDQNVTTVFHATDVAKETFDWVSLSLFDQFWFRRATGVDFGFIANQGREKASEVRLLNSS